jgi:hypothetical protein
VASGGHTGQSQARMGVSASGERRRWEARQRECLVLTDLRLGGSRRATAAAGGVLQRARVRER